MVPRSVTENCRGGSLIVPVMVPSYVTVMVPGYVRGKMCRSVMVPGYVTKVGRRVTARKIEGNDNWENESHDKRIQE